jgi:DNA processing protein
MESQLLYELALHLTPGIGNVNIKTLIGYCGSAEAVLKLPKGKLAKIPGIGLVTASKIRQGNFLRQAQEELKKAVSFGIQTISFTDKRYPKQLKAIPDAPAILFIKGNIDFANKKTVAIVGTRKATKYGLEMTASLIQELMPYHPIIVSGLAYGIDIKAHREAVNNGLKTVAVMASGADIIYPAAHKSVAKEIASHGALITEHVLGTPPDAPRFPARNRIIAGLADATIVIEAASKGGALITAEIANGYNRDVFALPGNIGTQFSAGCNQLIKTNKAHLITSAKDVAYIMGWDVDYRPEDSMPKIDLQQLTSDEQLIIELLSDNLNGLHIDLICMQSQCNASKTASVLLQLEFQGIVKSLPGKIYVLDLALE